MRTDDTLSPIPAYYRTPEWQQLRRDILTRDRGKCVYCGWEASTADHITPRKAGGSDHPDNLVACCLICNTIAGGKVFAELSAKKHWIARERRRLTRKVRGKPSFDRSHYAETLRLLRKKTR